MTGKLIKRESSRLGGKTYVLHTYSNGFQWIITQSAAQITAVRVKGHAVSNRHRFQRPPEGDRTPSGGAPRTHPSDTQG